MSKAEIGYNAYVEAVGGVTALSWSPPFSDLPPHIAAAWETAADAIENAVLEERR